MGRIVRDIEIEGRSLKALFDTGSFNSYITAPFATDARRPSVPITVGLGGTERYLSERCDLTATIEGLAFDMTAYVVDELGETEHGRLDAIVGALTMEAWWIKLDPKAGTLDLTQLRKREFTEY